MKTDIQTIGFEASSELIDRVNEYINKLQDMEDEIVGVDVYLKSLHDDEQQTKKAEFRLFVPGNDLYAEYQSSSFGDAIQQTYKKLRTQIIKRKELIRNNRL